MKRRLEKNINQPCTSNRAIPLINTSKQIKLITKQNQQTQTLKKQNCRRRRKMLSVEDLIKWLQKKNYIKGEDALLLSLTDVTTEELYLKNVDVTSNYSSELRTFALTLHYYSSEGYNNARNVFNLCLPHPYTIYKWYKRYDGTPGFTAESLEALKLLANKEKGSLYCCLMMDVMAIRRNVECDGNKLVGYVDFGSELDTDMESEASEVLVFLVTGLHKNWKVPVGYFMIDNLINGKSKANLVLQCLRHLNDSKISVVGFTFNDYNFSMAEILGCKLGLDDMKTTFKHPVTKQPIAIFLDPCTMMEFIRNCLHSYGQFVDGNGKCISWSHLETLNKLRMSDYSHLIKELRKNHINSITFLNQKHKVKLATKLLNKSVADSLDFCRDTLKIADLKESLATAEFIRILNDLFDVLNSRHIKQLDFKQPLSLNNKTKILDILNKAENYIKRLRTPQGNLLTKSGFVKKGFIGLLICIESTKVLFQLLVEGEKIRFMAMNKFSLSHLELLFGEVKAHSGSNKEPTAKKFLYFYKKLLKHVEIKNKNDSNYVELGKISILNCSSAVKIINATTTRSKLADRIDNVTERDIDQMPNFEEFSYFLPRITESEQFINYNAGYVVRILDKILVCDECNIAISLTKPGTGNTIKIVNFKDIDGLVYPSNDTIQICKVTELEIQTRIINKSYKLYVELSISKHIIINEVLRYFINRNIFDGIVVHQFDQSPTENHLVNLIKAIAGTYIDVRFRYLSEFLSFQRTKYELYSGSL